MNRPLLAGVCAAVLAFACGSASAAPALQVLGKDYTFPNQLDGVPHKLSDFPGLQINDFTTSDGVRINYWEAAAASR